MALMYRDFPAYFEHSLHRDRRRLMVLADTVKAVHNEMSRQKIDCGHTYDQLIPLCEVIANVAIDSFSEDYVLVRKGTGGVEYDGTTNHDPINFGTAVLESTVNIPISNQLAEAMAQLWQAEQRFQLVGPSNEEITIMAVPSTFIAQLFKDLIDAQT